MRGFSLEEKEVLLIASLKTTIQTHTMAQKLFTCFPPEVTYSCGDTVYS